MLESPNQKSTPKRRKLLYASQGEGDLIASLPNEGLVSEIDAVADDVARTIDVIDLFAGTDMPREVTNVSGVDSDALQRESHIAPFGTPVSAMQKSETEEAQSVVKRVRERISPRKDTGATLASDDKEPLRSNVTDVAGNRECDKSPLTAETTGKAEAKQQDEQPSIFQEEDLSKRTEDDPDWPGLRQRLDQRFYPYKTFDYEPGGKDWERDASELLEYLLALMPAGYAKRIRAGIAKEARRVRAERRKILFSQKRKYVTRELELANWDKWNTYYESSDDEEDEIVEKESTDAAVDNEVQKPKPVKLPFVVSIKRVLRRAIYREVTKLIIDGDLVDEKQRQKEEAEKALEEEKARKMQKRAETIAKGAAQAAAEAVSVHRGGRFWGLVDDEQGQTQKENKEKASDVDQEVDSQLEQKPNQRPERWQFSPFKDNLTGKPTLEPS